MVFYFCLLPLSCVLLHRSGVFHSWDLSNESLFYLLRGIRKGITKDYDGSFDDINKAVELQPRSAYAYNQQAILYLDQEKYDEGLVASQKALEINPNIGFHWYIFAYLQWYFLEPVTATGMDEVIKSIDRAIAMDPESARYHWARWRMLVSANRFEEAREEVKIFKGLITTDLDKEKARDMDLDYWYQYDNTIIRYA